MSLVGCCIIHHPADVSELVPGRCNDVAPVVAEQGTAEGQMVDHKLPLEGQGGHIIQEGGHVGMCKEGFDGGVDTVAGRFLLLVEETQEGLEEIGNVLACKGRSFYQWLCFRWSFRGKCQQIVNIHLEG